MKKYVVLFMVSIILLAPMVNVIAATKNLEKSEENLRSKSDVTEKVLKIGEKNEDVRALQETLKSNSEFYPEGLVTGYYGSMTEKAIKKVQKEYNLPLTGEVDRETRDVIYPNNFRLRVLSPNGREILKRGESYVISWEAVVRPERPVEINKVGGEDSLLPTPVTRYPFSPKIVLYLTSDSEDIFSSDRYIGSTNLFKSSYNWKVPNDIALGSNYRITAKVPGWASDSSDQTFVIEDNGGVSGVDANRLLKYIKEMKRLIAQLTSVLTEMNKLSANI